MADVKILNAKNNSYNIKDEQARTNVQSIINSFSFSSGEIETPFTFNGNNILRQHFAITRSVAERSSIDLVTLPTEYDILVLGFNGTIFHNDTHHFYPLNFYEPANATDPKEKSFICYFDPSSNTLKFTLNSYGYVNGIRGYIDYLKF